MIKINLKFFFSIIISILFIEFIYDIILTENIKLKYTKIFVKNNANSKSIKILLWTKFYKRNWWLQNDSHKCDNTNCIMSTNRTDISSYDAILFHWWNINPNDLPQQVFDDQKWVLYTNEQPRQTHIGLNYTGLKKVDWIMSYRTDSNIYTPYGKFVKCKNQWKQKYSFEAKTKSIAWFVSHCRTASNRIQYGQELSKYIDVDIYGKCGSLNCDRHNASHHCYDMLAKNYKFYLSFENGICKDYVTEKLFNYMDIEIIPIVMGGANYTQIAPHNSYIDVFNFSSPQHLADYLKIVGNNQTLYNSYLEWKKGYCIEKYFGTKYDFWKQFSRPCSLCEYMQNEEIKPSFRTIDQFRKWWITGSHCKTIKFKNGVMNLVNYTKEPGRPKYY